MLYREKTGSPVSNPPRSIFNQHLNDGGVPLVHVAPEVVQGQLVTSGERIVTKDAEVLHPGGALVGRDGPEASGLWRPGSRNVPRFLLDIDRGSRGGLDVLVVVSGFGDDFVLRPCTLRSLGKLMLLGGFIVAQSTTLSKQ
jgi:hypothetical protein